MVSSAVSPPLIVVISSEADAHIPFVQCHLEQPMLLITQASILEGRPFSYELHGGKLHILDNHKSIAAVSGVWYRRLERILPESFPVPEHLREYTDQTFRYFNQLICTRFSEALWISDPYAIARANDKVLQLELAARLGFKVPDTLVTSSPEAAANFVGKHKAAIVKSFNSPPFTKDGREHLFYTVKIDKNADFSGLHLAPAIFQQAIDPQAELRVTVVGDKVFAAQVSIQKPSKYVPVQVRDWRADYSALAIEAFELPPKIERLCRAHVHELGLQFGALDLIMDKKGIFWFLENNPNGQWAFIEQETKQPIGKAIADALAHGR